MRIGYYGFIPESEVDVLIDPPSDVSYQPETQPETVLSNSGLTELRRYTTRASYKIVLRWSDITERQLARLALIPPSEVIFLVNERGRTETVVLDEPVRSMKVGVSSFDGQSIYNATINAYPITQSAARQNVRLREGTALDTFETSKAPVALNRDEPAPPSPTPASYSPIKDSAKSGLPPTVGLGEGVRFTFTSFVDLYGRAEYFDVTGDARLELTYITPQDYVGWYSHVRTGGTQNEESILKRFPFDIRSDFTLGALLWLDGALGEGMLFRDGTSNALLNVSYRNGSISVVLHVDSTVHQCTFPLNTDEYHYLGIQYSNGNLTVLLDKVPQSTTTTTAPSPPLNVQTGFRVGGGPAYFDDLVLASSDGVNLNTVYDWMIRV